MVPPPPSSYIEREIAKAIISIRIKQLYF
jgi:hypothetical protein